MSHQTSFTVCGTADVAYTSICDSVQKLARGEPDAITTVKIVLLNRTSPRIGMIVGPGSLVGAELLRGIYGLSNAQARVALFVANRLTNVEIAGLVGASAHTVRKHVELVRLKMNAHSREEIQRRIEALSLYDRGDTTGDISMSVSNGRSS